MSPRQHDLLAILYTTVMPAVVTRRIKDKEITLDTYRLPLVRLKNGVVSPLSVNSSVVILDLHLPSPIRSTPRGEAQAVWPYLLCVRVWVFFQRPAEKVTQERELAL